MNDSKPVRLALAHAIERACEGTRVAVRPDDELRSNTFEEFRVSGKEGPFKVLVSDTVLASLSNTHNIEDGHPYESGDALSDALIAEMNSAEVLELIADASEGDIVEWTNDGARFLD